LQAQATPISLRDMPQMHREAARVESPDYVERIKDFFARHGGPGNRANRDGESAEGMQGWSEVYAGDGYVMRCDWTRFGNREEMKYSEIAPGAAAP
jgi:hypothetical protein